MKRWLRWLGIYLLVSIILSLALGAWIRNNFEKPVTYIGSQPLESEPSRRG